MFKGNRNSKKEFEKKMLIKKTLNEMNKQIQKLEEQKQVYINAGKLAKEKGLTKQFNLAMAGYKMTRDQQTKVYEMKLNFELTSQMKDMSQMTASFLSGMSSLSRDMAKLTREKDFLQVGKDFSSAMEAVEMQTERLEDFMDNTSSSFSSNTISSAEDNKEIEKIFESEAAIGEMSNDDIDDELEKLMKKMS